MAAEGPPEPSPRELTQGSPPVIERLEITPTEIEPGREIQVVAEASDPDGGPIRFLFTWKRNGEVVQRSSEPSIVFGQVSKTDSIVLEAIASDGRHKSSPVRLHATVGNRPPTLTRLEIDPADDLRAGMMVTATPYAEDPDNDPLTFEYRWLVNGALRGEKRRFDTSGLRRGDRILLEVQALDGEDRSRPYQVEARLGNTPPTIRSAGERPVGSLYRHQFEASDADGDRNLRFFLESGPAGMSMDAITGTLSWTPRPDQTGRYPVVVGVKDPQGDATTLSFSVQVAQVASGAEVEAPPPASREP